MTGWIANARMYSPAPEAAAAWRRLFDIVSDRSGIALTVIDHAYPAPLWELSRRDDLACAMMCGWPYALEGRRKKLVAAPVSADPAAAGKPVYRSLFVVRRESRFAALEDTFGHRMGFTVADSHSGCNAPRFHLLSHRAARGARLFAEVIGSIPTPRLMIEAVRDGRVDVGPVDSFAFDLLSHHAPDLVRAVRVIDATEPATIPAFVASPACPDDTVAALAEALCTVAEDPGSAALLDDLCIKAFARVGPTDYRTHERWAQAAEDAGYGVIA